MCFDVILMFFDVCRVVRFLMCSSDFVTFEVFHPVWALYNIIREAGHMSEPPPQASCAGQVFALSWHPALYRVPVCQTGAGGRTYFSMKEEAKRAPVEEKIFQQLPCPTSCPTFCLALSL